MNDSYVQLEDLLQEYSGREKQLALIGEHSLVYADFVKRQWKHTFPFQNLEEFKGIVHLAEMQGQLDVVGINGQFEYNRYIREQSAHLANSGLDSSAVEDSVIQSYQRHLYGSLRNINQTLTPQGRVILCINNGDQIRLDPQELERNEYTIGFENAKKTTYVLETLKRE